MFYYSPPPKKNECYIKNLTPYNGHFTCTSHVSNPVNTDTEGSRQCCSSNYSQVFVESRYILSLGLKHQKALSLTFLSFFFFFFYQRRVMCIVVKKIWGLGAPWSAKSRTIFIISEGYPSERKPHEFSSTFCLTVLISDFSRFRTTQEVKGNEVARTLAFHPCMWPGLRCRCRRLNNM